MMIPNKYQEEIYKFVKAQVDVMEKKGTPQNLVVEAGAGCGKSSTLVKSIDLIPRHLNVVFLAFNKDIVESLRDKVPPNTRVQTFHSAGFGALRYRFNKVILNDKKMMQIFQNLTYEKYRKLSQEEVSELMNPFLKLVGLIKNTFLEPDNRNLRSLIEKHDVDIGECDEDILFELIREGISISNANPTVVDYNDMIYLPVKLGLSFFKSDVAFVDETQDLNNSQLLMLMRMVKPKGFVVCVGDSDQSIYGFRGADTDAIQKMTRELNAAVLPLMMTYRCGKNIVKLANNLVPELEAYEGNVDGEVKDISYDNFYELVNEEDKILCRNTAPLIKPVFHILATGRKAIIKGRDIGEGLTLLVKKLKAERIEEFMNALDNWKLKEETKAKRKNSDSMMQSIQDKYNCLITISEDCENSKQIIDKIERIFADGRVGIIFSTIHRAKGLEAKKVFILEPELMPSKWAKKEWEIQQEKNIAYVAITRAMVNLYSVSGSINKAIEHLMGGQARGEEREEGVKDVREDVCESVNKVEEVKVEDIKKYVVTEVVDMSGEQDMSNQDNVFKKKVFKIKMKK